MALHEIAIGVISQLASDVASAIFKRLEETKSEKYLETVWEENISESYKSYLLKSSEKHSKIKTLLNMRTPIDLYSIYENIDVKYNDNIVKTDDLKNLTNISNRLIITGTGGIGKSTLSKHLFLNCVENRYYIPVLVELRHLNKINTEITSEVILEFIYGTITELNFDLSMEYLIQALSIGEIMIIFDALDEVKLEIIDSVINSIKSIGNRYDKSLIIVTSRPSDGFMGWNEYTELLTLNLNKEQAISMVNKVDIEEDIKTLFIEMLDEELYEKYESFASIPLLLLIMLITFESNALIPEELNDFYEKAFTALFNNHDALKSGYLRDISSKLGYDDFKNTLSYICFKSYFNFDSEFNENKILSYIRTALQNNNLSHVNEVSYLYDLINCVCILTKDGLEYKFTHRSFQEYFAAVFTSKLDDEMQKVVLETTCVTALPIFENKFINMFKEMQKERYIKNLIYPKAKAIHENNEKYKFLDIYQSVISIDDTYHIPSSIGEEYFIYLEMQDLVNIHVSTNNNLTEKLYWKILELTSKIESKTNGIGEVIEISTIKKLGYIEKLVECLNGYHEFEIAFDNWINEYEKKNSNKFKDINDVLNIL